MTLAVQGAVLVWLYVAWVLFWGARRIGLLPNFHRAQGYPPLSVIVAARDEADTLQEALSSLLQVDYPELEIILVNDRSTDATGDLMESMAAGDPRVRVLHLEQLPSGWLGKNHALFQGAQRASGQWLLFTDADICFDRLSLKRAMTLVEDEQLDHLVLGPQIRCLSFWEKIFVAYLATAFCFRYRPDLASQPGPYYVGVGAFNLVRAQAYHQQGGHSVFPRAVIDDMELGRLLKERGYRQRFVAAAEAVRVRWVVGLQGIFRGLEKNAFAGFRYSLPLALTGVLVILWGSSAPFLLLWLAQPGWALLGWSAMGLCGAIFAGGLGYPRWCGLCFPLAGWIMALVIVRACLLCTWRQGVYWRGTFYSLQELKS